MIVRFRPDANADLDDILRDLARIDAGVVGRFRMALAELVGDIGEWPKIGELLKRTASGMEVRRKTPRRFRNHQVVYVVSNDEVFVARVLHGARNWQSVLNAGLIEGLERGSP